MFWIGQRAALPKATRKNMPRIVSHFSCGAASAVATKLAIIEYGLSHEVVVLNAYVRAEHEDNRRFLRDCEAWFGQPVVVIRDAKYNADPMEVFRRKRFIKNKNGAPCSKAVKRDVQDEWCKPDDEHVLGFTFEESGRLDLWIDANPDKRVMAPLIEHKLRKPDVLAMVERAGIVLPLMYRLGYHNANCIACPKGGAGYWNKIRRDFPIQFEAMCRMEESLGVGARLLRHRSGPLKNQRFWLRELDPTTGRYEDEPSIECGAACEFVEGSTQGWDELNDLS